MGLQTRPLTWKHYLIIGLLYGLAYGGFFLLSWAMEGYADFSLWFPAAGIRFALIFVFGWRVGLVTILIEILVQGLLGWWSYHASPLTVLIGIGGPPAAYTLVLYALERLKVSSQRIARLPDLIWFSLAVLVAPAIAAVCSTTVGYMMRGLLPAELGQAVMSFWVGDTIGVLMFAPALVLLLNGQWRSRGEHFGAEFLLASLVCWLSTWFISGDSITIKWLPFLLPVVIMAVRHGIRGAAAIVLVLNIVAMLPATGLEAIDRIDLQSFLLVVSFSGILTGGLVSARRESERQLADSFQTISHLERNRSAGDMAAQLIHELTQPLGRRRCIAVVL